MVEEKDWSEAKIYVQATRCVWPHWVSEEVSFNSPFFSSCSSCLIPPVGGRVPRTWSFFTSSELTSCVQSSDWSNYPSLSFTDSAFFQSYVSCFAFLWPSELFSSGPSCCRSGDELSCTIRKILTKWHRLFTAPHHIIITCVTAPLFAWPLLDVLSDSHLYGT